MKRCKMLMINEKKTCDRQPTTGHSITWSGAHSRGVCARSCLFEVDDTQNGLCLLFVCETIVHGNETMILESV